MVDFLDLTMNNGMWVRLNMRYILKNGSTFDWTYHDTDHQMCGVPYFQTNPYHLSATNFLY
jgi:hypothetical protein